MDRTLLAEGYVRAAGEADRHVAPRGVGTVTEAGVAPVGEETAGDVRHPADQFTRFTQAGSTVGPLHGSHRPLRILVAVVQVRAAQTRGDAGQDKWSDQGGVLAHPHMEMWGFDRYRSFVTMGKVGMPAHHADVDRVLGDTRARRDTKAYGEDRLRQSGEVTVRIVDVDVDPAALVEDAIDLVDAERATRCAEQRAGQPLARVAVLVIAPVPASRDRGGIREVPAPIAGVEHPSGMRGWLRCAA